MYDTIIIGSGPAGMTSAIYAARREMKTLVVGKELGGQLVWASEIENYPGFKTISSFELISKLQEQVSALGVEFKQKEISKIVKEEDNTFTLHTSKETLKAKTVIIAMGLSPRRLAIPGEEEFNGKGVSYCANCDGPFYKEKTVAVVGGGNSALDAAEILSKIGKKVYLLHRSGEFRAFEALIREVNARGNIEVMMNIDIKEVLGSNKMEKIKIVNNQTNKEQEIEVDGIFIEIGRTANTDLVAELVERNKKKEIMVDELCRTNTPGLFAAGDVTQVMFKQIPIAMGQATTAALAAYQYLQLKEDKPVNVSDKSKSKTEK